MVEQTGGRQQRRVERMHWWRQVLDRPAPADHGLVFDEELRVRFALETLRESGANWSAVVSPR